MPKLEMTQAEIELLFEALDAWEQAPSHEGFISATINAVMAKDPQNRDQTMADTIAKAKQDELRRKRRSIMLKAKLIEALEQESADRLFNGTSTTEPG